MKPRIVDLEKKGLEWCCEYDLAKLLRLARAAKEYSDMTLMANDEADEDTKHHLEDRAEMDWDELQKALDAFNWGGDPEYRSASHERWDP